MEKVKSMDLINLIEMLFPFLGYPLEAKCVNYESRLVAIAL